MYHKRSICFFTLLLFIILYNSGSVSAESFLSEPDPKEAVAQNTAVLEYDTASDAKELLHWVEEHKFAAGYLRLTSDIYLKEYYQAMVHAPNAEAAVIDFNGFHIYAEGIVEISDLSFANSGEEGFFQAAKGSQVYIVSGSLQKSSQPLIRQEEGAFLCVDGTAGREEGSIHYAQYPVAGELIDRPETVLIEQGQAVQNHLPQTLHAEVCFQGKIELQEIPVQWRLQEEAAALENRQRSDLKGSFDILHTEEPSCTVAFRNQPVTFTSAEIQADSKAQLVFLDYTAPVLPMSVEMQYSFDGERFSSYQQSLESSESQCYAEWYFADPQYWQEGDILWDKEQNPAVYLRLKWLDAKNQSDAYSDTIRLDFKTMKMSGNISGNRGGGTDIVNPPSDFAPQQPREPENSQPSESNPPSETNQPSESNPPSETNQPSESNPPSETDQPSQLDLPSETNQPSELDQDSDSSLVLIPELKVSQSVGSVQPSKLNQEPETEKQTSVLPALDSGTPSKIKREETANEDMEDETEKEQGKGGQQISGRCVSRSDFVTMLAGFTLSALCMAAAGLYLYPLAFKRLAAKLLHIHKKEGCYGTK